MEGRKSKPNRTGGKREFQMGGSAMKMLRGKDEGWRSRGGSGVVSEILSNPWMLFNHHPALLSVLRHLWPRGWSQESSEASLYLSGESASCGPGQSHRN